MSKRRDTLLMETTAISPVRTAGEIIAELVAIGATEINQSFTDGKITGIRWMLNTPGGSRLFEMPIRSEGVYKILQDRRRDAWRYKTSDLEKAERVAWRQLLRWVEAQVAMIQTGMAQSSEVFLPYLWDAKQQQTLFQWMNQERFPALPAPKDLPQ